MAQCIWCGKKGFFLMVDQNKLCRNCQSSIYLDIQQRGRIVEESQELIEKSKNIKTKIHRIDVILEHIQTLKKYEEKNISTLTPSPSECEKNYIGLRDEIIYEDIINRIEKHLNKANLEITTKSKINEANKALLTIMEGKKEFLNKEKIQKLNAAEKEIKASINKTQLDEFIEEAKKAEFKNQKTKALDKYQEALYFLITDKVDDSLQKEKIDEIKSKISELSK